VEHGEVDPIRAEQQLDDRQVGLVAVRRDLNASRL
jgi:hypothetical protein